MLSWQMTQRTSAIVPKKKKEENEERKWLIIAKSQGISRKRLISLVVL